MNQLLDITALCNAAVAKHNEYRKIHSIPNMIISSDLNKTAQSWAEYLASSGNFQHSDPSQRNNAGENLYVSYTTAPTINITTLAKEAVKDWYDEVSKYDYNQPGFSSTTGHFTQVVWKNSTTLGCGVAQGVKTLDGIAYNAFYVVCQYAPAGNVQGQFHNNVIKP